MITFENLSYCYPKSTTEVLCDVSFSIQAGEWLTLIGRNGSGKSTLIRMINGLLFPTTGRVCIEGIEVTKENLWETRKKVGMVFQNPENQFVGTTVFDDLAFGMENFQMLQEEMRKRINVVLEEVEMMAYKYKAPQDLSGGQKQRIAIAGILAMNPKIIVLDEATSMLDPAGKVQLLQLLQQFKRTREMTIVSITHDLSELEYSDRTLILEKGKVVSLTSSKEILENRDLRERYELGNTFIDTMADALKEKGFDLQIKGQDTSRWVEEICQLFLKR